VILSLIFHSIELDLSMTKTRLKAAAHLGTAGGLGGNGGGVDERPNPGKMVSRIVQANQVAADVMRTGTNVLQGGWTLKQGGAPHRDAMRKKRAREDSREFEPTGRCFDPRRARFYVGFKKYQLL
jgi:hypothetical protein